MGKTPRIVDCAGEETAAMAKEESICTGLRSENVLPHAAKDIAKNAPRFSQMKKKPASG